MMLTLLILLSSAARSMHCVVRRETASHVFKESAYHKTIAARAAVRSASLASGQFNQWPLSYYLIEPEYSCDVDLRVGEVVGDGAKYICNPHHILQQPNCLYYGFGVNGNIEFDITFQNLFRCEMHTFDPTPSVVRGVQPANLKSRGIAFHNFGVAGSDGTITLEGSNVPVMSFQTIKERLNHTDKVIDVVKIDVEGSEWEAFRDLFAHCDTNEPYAHQFQVELHSATAALLTEFHDSMTRCGYRSFHKDANLYCPSCMEYAYAHWRFIKCQL
jgi:hypothetical protein